MLWRFMKMCVFLTAPQSSVVVSLVHAFGTFSGSCRDWIGGRTPRPQLDVSTCSPAHLPWVICTCDRTKWSVTSSLKRTSEWQRERGAEERQAIFMRSAVGHACMHEDVPTAVYTWHNVWCRVTCTLLIQWGVLTRAVSFTSRCSAAGLCVFMLSWLCWRPDWKSLSNLLFESF